MQVPAPYRLALPALLVAGLASRPAADTITGRVVDSNGVGIANVDIDAKNLGSGGDPSLSGDFTDASGFFTTTIPAGQYDLIFIPPTPPASTALTGTLDGVTVLGTINLGTIALPPGVALTGRTVDQNGIPVSGVNIDVIDDVSGDNLTVKGDTTDAFGNFSIAVPPNSIEVRFDATTVLVQKLASIALDLAPTVDTSVGDLLLPPGFTVSGTVVRASGGGAVSSADLDFIDTVTGDKAYTPSDNTSGSGVYSVVVAAGTWDIEICPRFSDLLVATRLSGVVVSADTALGTTALQTGVVLSGKVTGFDGTTQVNADVDAKDSASGTPIVTCSDNTDANGNYQVVVPTGTLDITFRPSGFSTPYGADLHVGVSVPGSTVLNGVLPSCPTGQNYGTGLAGTGGIVPHLTDQGGTPRSGNSAYALSLQDGKGGGTAILIAGIAPSGLPALGGTVLVDLLSGQYSLFLVLLDGTPGAGGAGTGTFPLPVPISALAGLTVYSQFAVLDMAAPANVALSEGLAITFCP